MRWSLGWIMSGREFWWLGTGSRSENGMGNM